MIYYSNNTQITIYWEGSLYFCLSIKWKYEEVWVDIYMSKYAVRALAKFNHPTHDKPQHSPHPWVSPVYGSRRQQSPTPTSTAPLINQAGTLRFQGIPDNFLYYGCSINPCILSALNEISPEQAKLTTNTAEKCDMLMNYLYTNPDAVI